jgi:hypothetical protein
MTAEERANKIFGLSNDGLTPNYSVKAIKQKVIEQIAEAEAAARLEGSCDTTLKAAIAKPERAQKEEPHATQRKND